jgi:hypothetical protein
MPQTLQPPRRGRVLDPSVHDGRHSLQVRLVDRRYGCRRVGRYPSGGRSPDGGNSVLRCAPRCYDGGDGSAASERVAGAARTLEASPISSGSTASPADIAAATARLSAGSGRMSDYRSGQCGMTFERDNRISGVGLPFDVSADESLPHE